MNDNMENPKIKAAAIIAAIGVTVCVMINIAVSIVGFGEMTMIGGSGLVNVILDILLKGFASLFAAISLLIAGNMAVGVFSRSRRGTSALAGAAAVLILFLSAGVFFLSYRSDFDEQRKIAETGKLGDLRLLIDCAADISSEYFEGYSIDEFVFSETDGGYAVTGHFNEEINGVNCRWEFFSAQIGKKDYEKLYFSDTNNGKAEAYITLYINSGFIRSFEETEIKEGETAV